MKTAMGGRKRGVFGGIPGVDFRGHFGLIEEYPGFWSENGYGGSK